uniref:Hydroxysteroid 11-beta dehydrogenase 1 like n=1 Tax=Pipistrellus kuhlii TaxID=59472 RepID=A0A7J7TAK5_PIPKU|nr:hydroxysteroid 11-beta dehydrogenase 1 like [Pipistrellus kuhlii]
MSLCLPGLPPGAHCPPGGFPAEGRVPTSFSSPYSAAKFALDSSPAPAAGAGCAGCGCAVTICVLGLQDRASAKEGDRSSMSLPLLLPELLHLLREDPHPAILEVGHSDTFERVAMTQDIIINTGRENRKTD